MSPPPDSVSATAARPPYPLWAALALATALVAALAWQVMRLREDQRWLADRVSQPYVGMFVPQVAATALDGRTVSLGQPQGRRQVLFFFTTTCPHCRASLPQLKLAARALRERGDVELIGVAFASPAQAAAYAREHALDFPLVARDDRRIAALFRARRVPSLLVIDGDGLVRYRHVGALDGKAPLQELLDAATATEPARSQASRRPAAAAQAPSRASEAALASR